MLAKAKFRIGALVFRIGYRHPTSFNRAFSVGSANMTKKIHAVIIGPPGSGKGTIANRIVKDFKLDHISSGDILRNHVRNKTEFGLQISSVLEKGNLVPFELLAPIIERETAGSNSPFGWLLDGYPRSQEQAERLQSVSPPNLAIYLNVPFETIINRIKHRWIHPGSGRVYNLEYNPPKVPFKDDVTNEPLEQREDDKPENTQHRLVVYQSMIDPVLSVYKKHDLLVEFTGTESDVIYPQVNKFLTEFKS